MINENDMHKLLDDLKRISRLVPILKYEIDVDQRERISTVLLDELQRITNDLEEIKSCKD